VYSVLSSTEAGPFIHGMVDPGLRATAPTPAAGRPADGWRVQIIGAGGAPVPHGQSGEIVVTSRFIASGYWSGSERKIRAFPSAPDEPEARVLKTGDRGRRRADGSIEFIGRTDERIKIHGHRIEPAEVEHVLATLPEVEDAAVVVRRTERGIPIALSAYVILRPDIRGILPRHLKSMLAQRVPRYMIPAQITLVHDFPRLDSLKIDRRALELLDLENATKIHQRHDNPVIGEISDIFEKIIGVSGATPEDTIASLGGDSLQEVNVMAELERRYAIAIPDDVVGGQPTIRSLANWLQGQTAASA